MSDAPDTSADISRRERASGWRTVQAVFPYLWPEDAPGIKLRVVLSLAALICAKLVAVYTPILYKGAVDSLAGEGVPPLALGAVGLTVAYGVNRFLSIGFEQLRDVIFARVGQQALRRLALQTFRHIHALSLRYHVSRRTGALSRIMDRGVKGVAFLLRFLLFSIGPLLLELVLICIVLLQVLNWTFLAVLVVTIVVYVWFTFAVTEWRVRIRKVMNDQDNEASQRAVDSLLNFETVKYFGAAGREADRYDSAMRGYETAAIRTANSLAVINAGQGLIINAGLVAVMAMAAAGVMAGDFTVGDFVMVNAYMLQIIAPLNFLGFVYREIRQALVDMGEMFDLLEQAREVSDAPGATALRVSGAAISFRDVRFGYDADREILKGLTLDVPAGRTVAIVGPTGSGKSTIGRLLFRFYDVTDGGISIDGQDIREVTQDSLHAAIGVVPQDTVLFNDTIGYNIAYGRADASQDQIEAAARAAQIHDFIASLPAGYDTLVGERGLKLSGGEKQRVGIARTLLKNPPILLLDEATSALDSETETSIQEALRRAGEGRTVITIAHRLSTVADADYIVVLEDGRMVEAGTHADLLARRGRYFRLWTLQQSEDAA